MTNPRTHSKPLGLCPSLAGFCFRSLGFLLGVLLGGRRGRGLQTRQARRGGRYGPLQPFPFLTGARCSAVLKLCPPSASTASLPTHGFCGGSVKTRYFSYPFIDSKNKDLLHVEGVLTWGSLSPLPKFFKCPRAFAEGTLTFIR